MVLISLQSKKFDNPQILKVLCKLEKMSNDNEILLCWIPSHTGISGDHQADKAAKSALSIILEKN